MYDKKLEERIALADKRWKQLNSQQHVQNNIAGIMHNQQDIDFVYPYYGKMGYDSWNRSTTYATSGFSHIRELALIAVSRIEGNEFTKPKIKDLDHASLMLAVACADEIVEVVAKYKKEYLKSQGRTDVIEAFYPDDRD